MKLDKSKSYGAIMGSANGAKYEQNGKEFDNNGDMIKSETAIIEPEKISEIQPRKLGRPYKT